MVAIQFLIIFISNAANNPYNMSIEERINQKIAESAPYFELIPGVVIIHYLNPSTVIYMTSSGLKRLNITLRELQQMDTEYHSRFFNPEDAADYVPKVLGMLERNNNQETVSFFQQVRANEQEEWEWYTSGTRIFMHDDEGRPLLTITVAIPIDAKHYFINKIERLHEENTFLRRHQKVFASLSKREKQILSFMALGKKVSEIAGTLFLSEETVKTHRRNVRKKIQAQNQYDIIRFAQSFNLI
jgi:DNA-binding CsgD family transcriptional regulator